MCADKTEFRISEKKNDTQSGDFDWFSNRYQSILIQRNIAIFLLIISTICIMVTGVSLAVITKNKTIEPFVVEIEKKSGVINYIDTSDNRANKYTQDEVLRNYFIKKYLDARETFDPHDNKYAYSTIVKALSSDEVFREFKSFMSSRRPDNPAIAFAYNTSCRVDITSISVLDDNKVQVRFAVTAKFSNNAEKKINRIATITYNYVIKEMNEVNRYINPLGFMVIEYRATNENYEVNN